MIQPLGLKVCYIIYHNYMARCVLYDIAANAAGMLYYIVA